MMAFLITCQVLTCSTSLVSGVIGFIKSFMFLERHVLVFGSLRSKVIKLEVNEPWPLGLVVCVVGFEVRIEAKRIARSRT